MKSWIFVRIAFAFTIISIAIFCHVKAVSTAYSTGIEVGNHQHEYDDAQISARARTRGFTEGFRFARRNPSVDLFGTDKFYECPGGPCAPGHAGTVIESESDEPIRLPFGFAWKLQREIRREMRALLLERPADAMRPENSHRLKMREFAPDESLLTAMNSQ